MRATPTVVKLYAPDIGNASARHQPLYHTGLQDNASFTPFARRLECRFRRRLASFRLHSSSRGGQVGEQAELRERPCGYAWRARIFEPVLDCRYSAAASSSTKPATREGDTQADSRLSCPLRGDT